MMSNIKFLCKLRFLLFQFIFISRPLYAVSIFDLNNFIIQTSFNDAVIKVEDVLANTKGKIISETNYNLNIEWHQKFLTKKSRKKPWKEIFDTKIFLNYKKFNLIDPVNRDILKNEFSAYEFGLGFKFFFYDKLFIDASISSSKEHYYTAPDESSILFKNIFSYKSKLLLGYNFFDNRFHKLGFNFGTVVILPEELENEYKTGLDYGFEGSTFCWLYNFNLTLSYEKIFKNSSSFKQEDNYYKLLIAYKFKI